LLILSLGLQALVQVASGDEGCTEEGRALLSALIDDRPAVALSAGVAWRSLPPTAPRVLISLYQTAEALLKNAGLVIARESDLISALSGKAFRPQDAAVSGWGRPAPSDWTGERAGGRVRVLTESAVSNLFPEGSGGPLKLLRGDVLTPLACDWLLAKKIPVIKE
jgi:hypothetical protein